MTLSVYPILPFSETLPHIWAGDGLPFQLPTFPDSFSASSPIVKNTFFVGSRLALNILGAGVGGKVGSEVGKAVGTYLFPELGPVMGAMIGGVLLAGIGGSVAEYIAQVHVEHVEKLKWGAIVGAGFVAATSYYSGFLNPLTSWKALGQRATMNLGQGYFCRASAVALDGEQADALLDFRYALLDVLGGEIFYRTGNFLGRRLEQRLNAQYLAQLDPDDKEIVLMTRGVLREIVEANNKYVQKTPRANFRQLMQAQRPRAIVVTCCDSRIQITALHKDATGDLLMIRHMGNQLATDPASIVFGVKKLKAPLLIFIGHTACGAIKTAARVADGLEAEIRRVAETLPHVHAGQEVTDEVCSNLSRQNVDEQVRLAMKKFADEVGNGKLAVMGAVYDLRNDFGQGHGRLIFTNINGITDRARIRHHPLLRGI